MKIYEYLPGTDWLAKKSGIVFCDAQGSFLWDKKGKKYVDFASGNMSVPFGHKNGFILSNMQRVWNKYWNIQDFMTEEKERAFWKIKEILPSWMERLVFHTSGTEAVESMMRAVVSATGRYTFIAFQRAFHGYTLGSRSLGPSILKGYGPLWGNVIYVPPPDCSRCPVNLKEDSCSAECFSLVRTAVESEGSQLPAAFLFEPILGAAGIIIPPEKYYRRLVDFCRNKGILLACDEILTGLWRFKKMFAYEKYDFQPDIIAFAKGLGNGFPVMCVAGKTEIMDSQPYSFNGWNTTTFGGNTLGWVAASSTLEYGAKFQATLDLDAKETLFLKFKSEVEKEFPQIQMRGEGLAWAFDFSNLKDPLSWGQQFSLKLLEKGIRVNDSYHIIRFLPPLTIEKDLLLQTFDKIKSILKVMFKKGEKG